MSPAMRIIHPTSGILKNVSFDSHFISHGRCEMSRMSTKLWWLATTTYGRRGSGMGAGGAERHSGFSVWCTTRELAEQVAGRVAALVERCGHQPHDGDHAASRR